jgi:ATP-dependent DNA helicase DinG
MSTAEGSAPTPLPDRAIERALARATRDLPKHEDRPQQRAMAFAVGAAIKQRRHLVVEAGTGTGKSLAYLVPALALGQRVVVSTATKALQDQLAHRDLPQLSRSLGVRFRYAVLKGRSNYLCRQRIEELSGATEQLLLSEDEAIGRASAGSMGPLGREVRRLVAWARSGADEKPPGDNSTLEKGTGEKGAGEKGAGEKGAGEKGAGGKKEGGFSGDRAELPWEPSESAWSQVSIGWRECPGAGECPSGADCFSEAARQRAARADVVVVNTHLYASSLAMNEAELLPVHDLVVFDEAHELEDIASAAFGFEVSQVRLVALARLARPLLADSSVAAAVEDGAALLGGVLRAHKDQPLQCPLEEDVAHVVSLLRERANLLLEGLRKSSGNAFESSGGAGTAGQPSNGGHGGSGKTGGPGGRKLASATGQRGGGASHGGAQGSKPSGGARKVRAQKAASLLVDELNEILELADGQVAWVEGPDQAPVLCVAPVDVGGALRQRLWQGEAAPTAVLTSATIPPHLGDRLGLDAGSYDEQDVGSPFSYSEQALLYCPVHLPDPRAEGFEAATHEELVALIEAAQGRTLALFTSWRAMQAAAKVVRDRVSWTIFTQSDLPKVKLISLFRSDEHSCLFATMGFWQGVDVPGPSLSLVTIDRLPFPRPDDPLLRARRDALGARAFELIDLPRAATLLAQGAGRLIRSRDDRGVVAVFDRRLGKARYRWELVDSLPPMRRTRSRAEVETFLRSLASGPA